MESSMMVGGRFKLVMLVGQFRQITVHGLVVAGRFHLNRYMFDTEV